MSKSRLSPFDVDHILYRIGLYLDTPPPPAPKILSNEESSDDTPFGQASSMPTPMAGFPTTVSETDSQMYTPSRELVVSVKVCRRWMAVLYPILHQQLQFGLQSHKTGVPHDGGKNENREDDQQGEDERKTSDVKEDEIINIGGKLGSYPSTMDRPQQRQSPHRFPRQQLHVIDEGHFSPPKFRQEISSCPSCSLRVAHTVQEYANDTDRLVMECVPLAERQHGALERLWRLKQLVRECRMDCAWVSSHAIDSGDMNGKEREGRARASGADGENETKETQGCMAEDVVSSLDEQHLAVLVTWLHDMSFYPWSTFATTAADTAASTVATLRLNHHICPLASSSFTETKSWLPLYTRPKAVFMTAMATMAITTLSLAIINRVDQRLHDLAALCPQLETLSLLGQPQTLSDWRAVMQQLCRHVRDGCPPVLVSTVEADSIRPYGLVLDKEDEPLIQTR
ncbi:hypothetical protein DFQ26_004798 [Actinomortierella ambigua]|nr:hypothetical protein DFQ26_004798 [Actinomortierella ambigua]